VLQMLYRVLSAEPRFAIFRPTTFF
jgi:hypothetical protein